MIFENHFLSLLNLKLLKNNNADNIQSTILFYLLTIIYSSFAIIILISKMKNLRYREVKKLTEDHTAFWCDRRSVEVKSMWC